MVKGSLEGGPIGNEDNDKASRPSGSQDSDASDGCLLCSFGVRCLGNGSGELAIRCRLPRAFPTLRGEEAWSKKRVWLLGLVNGKYGFTGVSVVEESNSVALDRGEDCRASNGFASRVGMRLMSGVPRDPVSIVKDNSRELECKGWLGLGKRQGWSDGRRGGECRKDGVCKGL